MFKCPECGSTAIIKYGKKFRNRRRIQQYRCNNCGRVSVNPRGEK